MQPSAENRIWSAKTKTILGRLVEDVRETQPTPAAASEAVNDLRLIAEGIRFSLQTAWTDT